MGLDNHGTKFLPYARKRGVSFEKAAMVGRQFVYASAYNIRKNFQQLGFQLTEQEAERILTEAGGYAEPFLKQLGAEEIESFDASGYENATHVHDFNLPIPDRFKNRFSAVLDGGTLEHIFNFPTAIKNCMEMVAEGGHFLSITPTNNFLGHGFYQYSPELFFRILSGQNGYKLKEMLIFEDYYDSEWYSVVDPEEISERVTLTNKEPTYLLIIAEKIKTVPIFEQTPQQSDYFAKWQNESSSVRTNGKPPESHSSSLIRNMVRPPLNFVRQTIRGLKTNQIKSNPKHFKKLDLP